MGAIGVALVGLGRCGCDHLRALAESEEAILRWLCDLDPRRVRERIGGTGASAATDLDAVLEDAETKAIVLATPTASHFELASRCIEAGKHVLVEQPLAASSGEAAELIQLGRDRGLAVMCAHTSLFSPASRAVAGQIADGRLGELQYVASSRVELGFDRRGTSVLWELAPSELALLLDWFDEMPERVSALGRRGLSERLTETAFVTLAYASGPIAGLELSWLAPANLRRTVIAGSEGTIAYEGAATSRVDTEAPVAVQLREFVSAARRGRAPDRHLRLARDVVELVEAAEDSLQSGGIAVPVRDFRHHDLRAAA